LRQNQQFCSRMRGRSRMEYIMEHVHKPLHDQTAHAPAILEQMKVFHDNFKSEKHGRYECMCTFVAFGNSTERTLLMSCLMYALQPELLYSAYVKSYDSKEYETILLLKKHIPVDMLESFLELFRMSTCVIPFDTLMSDEMATSIARIHTGANQYGNFHSKVNTNLRRKYYYRRQKQKQKLELQHVVQVTGLPFTADNMIRLYHELAVSRCDNASLRARVQHFQETLATLRM
jgi:hypothetical protein